ncbi:hypothetical protein [uncultured Aquimarina sp.]|uniref:hypothetical protein n=1 Tax=uncultured Aquimarina sp. TaxID=575652 RepID=UPI002616FA68|nr:hypothetical protein [uncultured Aquimarina sp.]
MKLFIIVLILISVFVVVKEIVVRYKEGKRGWKTYRKERDQIVYAQKVDGEWKKIEIDGEMLGLGGRTGFVIYFNSIAKWNEYPSWAKNREEIIKRIKQNYPPKNTEYEYD